jgi:hypothetical protein
LLLTYSNIVSLKLTCSRIVFIVHMLMFTSFTIRILSLLRAKALRTSFARRTKVLLLVGYISLSLLAIARVLTCLLVYSLCSNTRMYYFPNPMSTLSVFAALIGYECPSAITRTICVGPKGPGLM